MKLKPEQLDRHLAEKLLPVYLISGDEPLLVQEACDQIRRSAREKGFLERELLHGEKGDVDVLNAASETMSLFAEQKMYELRFQKIPSAEFAKAIDNWCQNPPEDQCLLISCAKLDKRTMNQAWYKIVEKMGLHIAVWPVEGNNLYRFLQQRARSKGLHLQEDALAVLCERVEGNLLAAQQEIDRLVLLYAGTEALSVEKVQEYVADNARYDSYELLESCFNGDVKKLTRILTGLRLEGEAIARINALLTYELRNLTKMAWDLSKGESIQQLIQKYRIWGNKKSGYTRALDRYPVFVWQKLLSRCLELDKIIKGQQQGQAWIAMESLLLQIAGKGLWKKLPQ